MATYDKSLISRVLIDLSFNSSRLEGNTYSLLETEKLIASGKIASDKNELEAQMILNHKDALNFLLDLHAENQLAITPFIIYNLHALLSNNLLGDPKQSGALRSIMVGIGKSVYQPLAIPQLIQENFALTLEKAAKIHDPFEQSFFLFVHLPYLQPFIDVNKRASRLAANIPLIMNNCCPLSFIDVPTKHYINALIGIYELNQIDLAAELYIWGYRRSSANYLALKESLGQPDPFRLNYHKEMMACIQYIVQNAFSKEKTTKSIRTWAKKHIPKADQLQFTSTIEQELQGLHEGNISRYRLTLQEYKKWCKTFE